MLVEMDSGKKRATDKWSFTFLIHNVLIHPLAGVFWFLGLGAIGNRIHSIYQPK